MRRVRPALGNQEEQTLLTVALIPQPKAYKSSKMLVNALESGDLVRLPAADASMEESTNSELLTADVEVRDKPYSFGYVGLKMQRRLPLRQPYEQMLQRHMSDLKVRIKKKLEEFERKGDKKKLR